MEYGVSLWYSNSAWISIKIKLIPFKLIHFKTKTVNLLVTNKQYRLNDLMIFIKSLNKCIKNIFPNINKYNSSILKETVFVSSVKSQENQLGTIVSWVTIQDYILIFLDNKNFVIKYIEKFIRFYSEATRKGCIE